LSKLRVIRQGQELKLEGELRMASMPQALALLRRELGLGSVIAIDLAGVTACDSSAVALMLEMKRQGVAAIRHLPSDMEAIVRACQLEELLQADLPPSATVADGVPNHNENS